MILDLSPSAANPQNDRWSRRVNSSRDWWPPAGCGRWIPRQWMNSRTTLVRGLAS